MIKNIVSVFLTCLLTACGGGANPDLEAQEAIPDSQKLGGQKAEVIGSADDLTFSNGTLEGTGTIRFAMPLKKTDSANNFNLSFKLDDNSQITLIANASRNLSGGVEVSFSKAAGSQKLVVVAKAGADVFDISSSFSTVDASKHLAFAVDIHNDHGANVHLIIWDEVNNSAELIEDLLNGRGVGSNWGLKIKNAKLINIKLDAPRDNH